MGRRIRVVFADDEALAREGIRAVLSRAQDIEIVGEGRDGYEAQRLISELKPDVLLLDYKMPGPKPAELERWVRANFPETATLVLTGHDHTSHLAVMKEAGAAGYLTKEVSGDSLVDSIRRAARGMSCFDEEQILTAQKWMEEAGQKWESMNPRERQVLKMLTAGSSNRFIAEQLQITPKTVECHITKILAKIGLETRNEAMAWMVNNLPDEASNYDW